MNAMMPSGASDTAAFSFYRKLHTGDTVAGWVSAELAAGRAVVCVTHGRGFARDRSALLAEWCEQTEDDRRVEQAIGAVTFAGAR